MHITIYGIVCISSSVGNRRNLWYYSGLPVSTEMTFSHYGPALLEATRIRFLNTSAITLSGLTSLLNVS